MFPTHFYKQENRPIAALGGMQMFVFCEFSQKDASQQVKGVPHVFKCDFTKPQDILRWERAVVAL